MYSGARGAELSNMSQPLDEPEARPLLIEVVAPTYSPSLRHIIVTIRTSLRDTLPCCYPVVTTPRTTQRHQLPSTSSGPGQPLVNYADASCPRNSHQPYTTRETGAFRSPSHRHLLPEASRRHGRTRRRFQSLHSSLQPGHRLPSSYTTQLGLVIPGYTSGIDCVVFNLSLIQIAFTIQVKIYLSQSTANFKYLVSIIAIYNVISIN